MKHDPLAAISEAEATGETAAVFADIRSTMRLPILTSIWRTLAGVEGGLSATWESAKLLLETGYPEVLVSSFREPALLPMPSEKAKDRLDALVLPVLEREAIQNIINVYTRSNSLNMIVLTALFAEPAGTVPDKKTNLRMPSVPELPPLLSQDEIEPAIWQLLLDINRFGAFPDEPGMATLWRHLAHWPDVLAVIHEALSPLEENDVISDSVTHILNLACIEGGRLAAVRPKNVRIPESAQRMITKYVSHPGLVARMVAIGNGLSLWFQSDSGYGY